MSIIFTIMDGKYISTGQVSVIRQTNLPICTKIIIVTDGEPTELELVAGPDIADPRKIGEVSEIYSHWMLYLCL